MTAPDRDSHHVDHIHPDSAIEACPICGRPPEDHDRGAVDFYCPAPREARDGN